MTCLESVRSSSKTIMIKVERTNLGKKGKNSKTKRSKDFYLLPLNKTTSLDPRSHRNLKEAIVL